MLSGWFKKVAKIIKSPVQMEGPGLSLPAGRNKRMRVMSCQARKAQTMLLAELPKMKIDNAMAASTLTSTQFRAFLKMKAVAQIIMPQKTL